MATATKKTPAETSPARVARSVSQVPSLAFHTCCDNGGSYHWEIVDASGESLARSGSFISQADAERAARDVHRGVHSASFESHSADERRDVGS